MGECRAHGNLGSAFFSKGNYREALTNHRHQLVLAMKLKDREVGEEGRSTEGVLRDLFAVKKAEASRAGLGMPNLHQAW